MGKRLKPCWSCLPRLLLLSGILVSFISFPAGSCRADLPSTIDRVRPGIVGVGTVQKTRRPPAKLTATGFVVADGKHVITNAHVVPEEIDTQNLEYLAVFSGKGKRPETRQAVTLRIDAAHDLALLKFEGTPLPALSLGESDDVREGYEYAFTGFPMGTVFGLYPVTHRGIVSAIIPFAVRANSSKDLDRKLIKRLRSSYDVFQLDATAYPGNSGSPLYHPQSAEVVGIINSVFIKEGRENVLAKPSGISYAIPIKYARRLLEQAGLSP